MSKVYVYNGTHTSREYRFGGSINQTISLPANSYLILDVRAATTITDEIGYTWSFYGRDDGVYIDAYGKSYYVAVTDGLNLVNPTSTDVYYQGQKVPSYGAARVDEPTFSLKTWDGYNWKNAVDTTGIVEGRDDVASLMLSPYPFTGSITVEIKKL